MADEVEFVKKVLVINRSINLSKSEGHTTYYNFP